MARETSDFPTSIDTFDHATTDFNPGDAVPSSDFEVILDSIKTIQTKLGITGGTALLDSAVTVNNSEADKDFRVAAVGATNAFFVQGSDGKVGIGTPTIPHGGVGYALLQLYAVSGSTGPHIQATTDEDDYPVWQILTWAHDGFSLYIDAYNDGTTRSSDAGSNFGIRKAGDVLKIVYDSGVAQGAAVTWNDGIVLDTSGIVGIPGKLGLGTTTVPHGGVGAAKFAIEGADSSITDGPNIQITTDADDYPLLSMIFYIHDNMRIMFDAYYSSGDKSSDAGSNFGISKTGDLFKIRYDSGVAQGAAVTWNDGIVLDTSGDVTIPSLGGSGNIHVLADNNGKLYIGGGA